MRTLLAVSAAFFALTTGAFAQTQGPTPISRLCGVDYVMTDPDPNIRLELLRDCSSAGLEGGAD